MKSNQVTKITPDNSIALEWRELLQQLELLKYFVWRNFKVRYKQTVIGAGWAIFKPFILMLVFTFSFNKIGGVEGGDNIPYPIFAYAGLMFWVFFSQTVTQVATSFVTFQSIINKIYFPRLIVPISVVSTGLVDFGFSLIVFAGLMFYYGIPLTLYGALVFIPLVLLASITILGIGMTAAAVNVKYRDVAQILPFAVQALLFLTPVIYPVTRVPEGLQWVLYLNPMTGVITTAQTALLGIGEIQGGDLAISIASAIVIFIFSLYFFKSKEREFADLI